MDKIRIAITLATICSIFLGASVSAQHPPKHSAHAGKSRLHPALFPKRTKGKILVTVSHNEYFPPLPEALRPGAIFDSKNIADPMAKSESRWYQVPKWITGEFSYGGTTSYLEKDFRKGTESNPNSKSGPLPSGRYRGILLDKKGDIWQKAYGGSISDPTKNDEDVHKRYDDELSGYMLSPTEYVENSAGIEFYLDKETHKILATLRWERIRNFQYKNGTVEVDVSEEKFDPDGKPLYLIKFRGPMIKRHDFVPLAPGQEDDIAGTYPEAVRDLRKYMEAAGIPELMPDAPTETSPEANSRMDDKTKEAGGK